MPPSMFGSQNVITGGNFQQIFTSSKGPFDRLLKAASPAAFHNSNDRRDAPKCHPNTRVAVLQKIMDWIHRLDPETLESFILWLYGPAGSGKSAIAQSIAELCYEEGILVSSYFFSRFDATRNNARHLIATIAYQATLYFPTIKDHIIAPIDHDPLIFSRSLDTQMLSLLIQPIRELANSGYFETPTVPRVVILDGLDECEDSNDQLEILDVISRALQNHHIPLIFLIASRPEHDIKNYFGVGYLGDNTTRIALDDEYLPSDDILLLLKDKFAEIKQTHPFKGQIPTMWPSEGDLQMLVKKSSGQFIYAATVIKFVKSSRHRPPLRLEIILGIRPADRQLPFAELDSLYRHILSSVEDIESVLRILSLHFLSSRWSIAMPDIEELLSLGDGGVSELMCDLTALISTEKPVPYQGGYLDYPRMRVFHASLEDFLLDQSRSKQFWIDAEVRHVECARLLIHHIQEGLEQMEPRQAILLAIHFIGCSMPKLELYTDLMESSLGSFIIDSGYLSWINDFLGCIKHWKIDNLPDLYDHHLRIFDRFAQEKMEKLYSDPVLTALVSIATPGTGPSSTGETSALFSLNKARRNLDELSFSYWVFHSMYYGGYGIFMSEFLENPARSGIYALNGERYSIAAVYFLKYISSHSEHIIPSNATVRRKYNKQRSTPWLWRKTVEKAHSSEAAQIRRWQLHNRKAYSLLPHSLEAAFYRALTSLVHVLPRSDFSEELVILARQQRFGPLTWKEAGQKSAVKQEIARYLARVDSGDTSRG